MHQLLPKQCHNGCVPQKPHTCECWPQVLGKKDVHITVQDTVTTSQFALIWASLGLQISSGLIAAIFNKYGQNACGEMPILVGAQL